MTLPSSIVPRWQRLAAAGVAGVSAAALARHYTADPRHLPDIFLPWRAAVALREGVNPWELIGVGRPVDPGAGLMYPATAAVILLPFASISLPTAATLWAGLGAGMVAYAVAARGLWRLAAFLSWPVILAVSLQQWALLLTAAACLPLLGGILVGKPTVGAALALMRLDARWWRAAVIGGAAVIAISLALVPTWPRDWWTALHEPLAPGADIRDIRGIYFEPVRAPLGFLLLVGLARWRRPEARLLAAMACVPHIPMGYEYSAVMFLVPATLTECLSLAMLSWLHATLYRLWALQPTIHDTFARAVVLSVWLILAPATLLVLRRPNEGDAPVWLERIVARVAALARRQPTNCIDAEESGR